MPRVNIIQDDVVHWAKNYNGQKFHALLCDPPYHLISDTRNGSLRNPGTGPYGRHTVSTNTGFMGMDWDGRSEEHGEIAFNPETWKALGEHLYPGGIGMAFASARGFHRMMCAIEDAGFIIHNNLFIGWVRGQGFPKGVRVKGEEVFNGHRYGMSALKPALEPLIIFQKPFDGSQRDNIIATGAGAYNIDGTRIGYQSDKDKEQYMNDSEGGYKRQKTWNLDNPENPYHGGWKKLEGEVPDVLGRWPSNFIMVHTPSCRKVGENKTKGKEGGYSYKDKTYQVEGFVPKCKPQAPSNYGGETIEEWECTEDCPVRLFNEQAGSHKGTRCEKQSDCAENGKWGTLQGRRGARGYNDDGGASRYFFCADWSAEILENLENANSVFYASTSSRNERDAGLDGMKANGRITPMAGRGQPGLKCKKCGHWKNSGSPCICKEPEFEQSKFESPATLNPHPTVKPLSLTKYLSTMKK